MKHLIYLIVFAISTTGFSQSFQESIEVSGGNRPFESVAGISNSEYNSLFGNLEDFSKVMGVLYEFDDIRFAKLGTDGTFLLYDEWENVGNIKVGERTFQLVNVNFHVQREELMTKIDNDSIFLFDLNTLDEFTINNRRFKKLQNAKDGTFGVYEVVHETPTIKLLKKHSADMQQASPNPMLNRGRNKIIKKESYFISVNGAIEPFNLNKSNFQDLVPKDERRSFHSKVKDNHLNYRDESDAAKIIDLLESNDSK